MYPNVTQREKEVLLALAAGHSTREISMLLGITFNTVETHRKKLLNKFRSKNTAQMMLAASRLMPRDFWTRS
jgi:DNA-binding CsgD family transcriptional regulator